MPREPGAPDADDDRGGDAACWLRRVCQACGSMADADPPTTCPVCGAALSAG
jgi:rubrerythrin